MAHDRTPAPVARPGGVVLGQVELTLFASGEVGFRTNIEDRDAVVRILEGTLRAMEAARTFSARATIQGRDLVPQEGATR